MFDFADPRTRAVPAPALLAKTEAQAPLRRPRPLAEAARVGAELYRRERHLRPLLPAMATPQRRARDVAARLAPIEAALEAERRAGAPSYAPRRHVLALSALLAERAAAGLS